MRHKIAEKEFPPIVAQRTECSVCGQKLPQALISLPQLPLTSIYAKKIIEAYAGGIDQFFCLCLRCGHGQITRCLNSDYLYGMAYGFRTSQSESAKAGTDVFLAFINHLTGGRRFKGVIDIGCNDLFLLKRLKNHANHLLGIDPIWMDCEDRRGRENIQLIGKVIEDVDFNDYLKAPPDLIVCRHTLEHIRNPKKVLEKLLEIASEETLFVFEVPSLDCLFEGFRFDRIFHQHLQYFSFDSLQWLLKDIGAQYLDSRINYEHWGALLFAFRKRKKTKRPSLNLGQRDYQDLARRMKHRYEDFRGNMQMVGQHIEGLNHRKTYGYGASFMLPVLFYHLGIRPWQLKIIFDDDVKNHNLSYANLDVIIKKPHSLSLMRDSNVVITALDHMRPIFKKILPYQPHQIIMPLNLT